VDRDCLALEGRDGEFWGIVDQAELALRRDEIGDRLVVLVGEGEACDERDRRQFQLLDLLLHRLGMVDHGMRAEVETPFLRFRPRGGGDDRQPGEAARELDQDRADAPGAAGDQERARVDALTRHGAEPVEQQFPCGDRGQRQRCGLRECERLRLAADDPLIDQMKFRIRALAQDRAGVKHFVARLEQGHVGSDGIDNAGRVIAQDLCFTLGRGGALAHLVVDRVGRYRLDGDPDVAALRLRLGGLEIDQRICVLDGERFFVPDGLHVRALLFA
jgi:hypothetical protein